jgi:hypothetical protein
MPRFVFHSSENHYKVQIVNKILKKMDWVRRIAIAPTIITLTILVIASLNIQLASSQSVTRDRCFSYDEGLLLG